MVPRLSEHGFVGFRLIAGLAEFVPGVDTGKHWIEAIPRPLLLVEALDDLPQLLLEVVGNGLVVLVVLLGIGFGVPFDEY